MLFLYSISDTKSRNTDFEVVYDLAHRRRWFVTNFRLHFPFSQILMLESSCYVKSRLEKQKLFIKRSVCFGWKTANAFSFLHAGTKML